MAILPLQLARVSTYLQSTLSLSTIAKTQQNLLEVQNQLSTGVRLNAPSDDPGNSQIAIQLQRTLDKQQAYTQTIQGADSRLSLVDSTLGDVTSLLNQAQSLASQNVGSDVTAEQRKSAAAVVQSIYSQLLTLANRQSGGLYIFGGDNNGSAPYVESGGGVKYVGSPATLKNLVDDNTPFEINVDGSKVFGGAASAVNGINLQPALTPTTRLTDLAGAQSTGIARGSILISDGTTSRTVDLTQADTVQDVINAINGSGLATASLSGTSFRLSPVSGTGNLTVREVGANSTAADLGILRTTGPGPAFSYTGSPTSPRITPLTPLSALNNGTGINLASGIQISNGTATYTVSFAGATTIQDVLNAINGSGSDAVASINAAGNGIDVANVAQGTELRITENGGNAAANLGLRTFNTTTPLSSLNSGRGVQTNSGPDFEIVDRLGNAHQIDVDGAVTISDILSRINAATGSAVTAGFASNANGISLQDNTGGSGPFIVRSVNFSTAAADLGIQGTFTSSNIQGTDVNPVRSTGVFDNLLQLAAALQSNNQSAITRAATGLATDLTKVIGARGQNGARLQELQSRKDSLQTQNLATKSLLSDIKDTDYPSAIAKFQLLQTTLQANYQSTAKLANQSLLDYIK